MLQDENANIESTVSPSPCNDAQEHIETDHNESISISGTETTADKGVQANAKVLVSMFRTIGTQTEISELSKKSIA